MQLVNSKEKLLTKAERFILMETISIISGGAGFIGYSLCEKLLNEGRTVIVIDNLSRGCLKHIERLSNSKLIFIEADLSNRTDARDAFTRANAIGKVDEVWHLAANSDIPAGVADADVDLKDTFLTSVEILRCMKTFSIDKIYFASSSAVYGDLGDRPLHEDIGPLLPISNYGAMKLASEAIISAAAESYLDRACLFRFPNVVGIPATHGVILDFIRKLKTNGSNLDVLGNGTQRKAYLHVSDLVAAMLLVRSRTDITKTLPINIGPIDEGVYVRWIAEEVVKRVSPRARILFGSGNRGWVGDVPKFHYSTERIQSLGWTPMLGSDAAVLRAIDEIACQEGF
jgi:UDP-glucose 4-epimerase